MSTPTPPPATGPGTLTDAIYRASLDPARRALIEGSLTGPFAGIPYAWLADRTVNLYMAAGTTLTLSDGTLRKVDSVIQYGAETQAAGDALLRAAQLTGLPIDMDLMMRRWPASTMLIRENNHWPYIPPYGAADVTIGPGLSVPGEFSNLPATMPAGWILVSSDAAKYPPYVAPGTTQPPSPTAWAVDLTQMLYWTDPPALQDGVMIPAKTHYYFAPVRGQNPPLNAKCNFQGSAFMCQYYPNPEPIGGMIRMWLLIGPATA